MTFRESIFIKCSLRSYAFLHSLNEKQRRFYISIIYFNNAFSQQYLFQKQPPEVFCKKNTCARDLRPATLFKKRTWHRCFSVNFAKFLRAPFQQNTSGCLLLYFAIKIPLLFAKTDYFRVHFRKTEMYK